MELIVEGRHGQLLASAGLGGPAQGLGAFQAPLLEPGRPSVVLRQGAAVTASALEAVAVTGAPRPATEVGIRTAKAAPVRRLATGTWLVPALGATPTAATTPGGPAAVGPTGVPTGQLAALGRLGAIALVPTVVLVQLASVVALGLVPQAPEELAASASRQARVSPDGPTRTQAGPVVRRAVEARQAITRPRCTVGRLTPVEAVAAVAIAGAKALPGTVAVPCQAVVVATEARRFPSVAGVPLPSTSCASAPVLRGTSAAVSLGPTRPANELTLRGVPVAALAVAPLSAAPSPTATAAVPSRVPAPVAPALQSRALRVAKALLLAASPDTEGRPPTSSSVALRPTAAGASTTSAVATTLAPTPAVVHSL